MTRDEILRVFLEDVLPVSTGAVHKAVRDLQAENERLAAEIAALRATLIGWVELGEEMRRILENDVLIADWFAPRLYAALARGSAPSRDPVTPHHEPAFTTFLRWLEAEPDFQQMAAPDLCVEEDGAIGLDFGETGCSLSISVHADGRIGWSALIGTWSSHGHSYLPDIPDGLREALQRYARLPVLDSAAPPTAERP